MHVRIVPIILTLMLIVIISLSINIYADSFINDPVYGCIWEEEGQQEAYDNNQNTLSILDKYYRYSGYTGTAENYFRDFESCQKLSEIYNKTDELIQGKESDQEKAQAIHDWIVYNISYSYESSYDGSDIHHACANPFMVWANRRGVCWGYANLTDLMMQHAGINCVVVRGITPEGTHVWNAALIDGAWYYLDNTWDASYYEQLGKLSNTYFIKGCDVFSKNHEARIVESCGGDSYSWIVMTSVESENQMVSISFDPNGGTIDISEALLIKDSDVNHIPTPVRKGYQFDGWYTAAIGGTNIQRLGTGTLYSYKPSVTTTLYAHWIKDGAREETATNDTGKQVAKHEEMKKSSVYDSRMPKVSITKAFKGKKAFTVKWNKLPKNKQKKIDGFEVQYSLNKQFTKAAALKSVKMTKSSVTIKKLKSKKSYFVRVRTYKKVKGIKHFSKWSKVKKIKTK